MSDETKVHSKMVLKLNQPISGYRRRALMQKWLEHYRGAATTDDLAVIPAEAKYAS